MEQKTVNVRMLLKIEMVVEQDADIDDIIDQLEVEVPNPPPNTTIVSISTFNEEHELTDENDEDDENDENDAFF